MIRRHLVPVLVLGLVVGGAPSIAAHGDPGSSSYDLLVPGDFWSGSISFVTLVGPPEGEEVLHTTWHLTFFSPAGGTPASDVVLELQMPLASGFQTWVVHGSDFGWPSANGTFEGTLDSDQLNGVLAGGLFGFSTPELTIGAVGGGLTGQFQSSTIELELKGDATCQQDLGFGGPGRVSLSICGEPLATGGSAQLAMTGAPAFAPTYLLVGVDNSPTPFKGGLLVPVPVLLTVPFVSNGAGALGLPLHGGGGPVTVFLQAVVQDGVQPAGWAVSNALEVALLP